MQLCVKQKARNYANTTGEGGQSLDSSLSPRLLSQWGYPDPVFNQFTFLTNLAADASLFFLYRCLKPIGWIFCFGRTFRPAPCVRPCNVGICCTIKLPDQRILGTAAFAIWKPELISFQALNGDSEKLSGIVLIFERSVLAKEWPKWEKAITYFLRCEPSELSPRIGIRHLFTWASTQRQCITCVCVCVCVCVSLYVCVCVCLCVDSWCLVIVFERQNRNLSLTVEFGQPAQKAIYIWPAYTLHAFLQCESQGRNAKKLTLSLHRCTDKFSNIDF